MVSLWPFKGDESSPAAFEKALSTLSGKIARATSRLESARQRSRRWRALWTLWSGFAYVLYLMIVGFVVGWKNCNALEYTAVAAGPVVIYLVRFALVSYYDYRTSSMQLYVTGLQKQRDATIDKLKAATKYNTTQELLDKYGGADKLKRTPSVGRKRKEDLTQPSVPVARTGLAPPPTANIPGRPSSTTTSINLQSGLQAPHQRLAPPSGVAPGSPRLAQPPQSPIPTTEEFAPNAFPAPSQHVQTNSGTHWYDRLLDVLLGDDESNPKNRLALICKNCRLVNGQAPPGVMTLEAVGKWRCLRCGTMNGEESEAKLIVADVRREVRAATPNLPESEPGSPIETRDMGKMDDDGLESDEGQYSEGEKSDR